MHEGCRAHGQPAECAIFKFRLHLEGEGLMAIDEKYQSDHLMLLVGSNPLPNRATHYNFK